MISKGFVSLYLLLTFYSLFSLLQASALIHVQVVNANTSVSQRLPDFVIEDDSIITFQSNAPNPTQGGVIGTLLPFSPLDACQPLSPSFFTRNDTMTFSIVGSITALVVRGGCSFDTKFDNIQAIHNVVSVILINVDDSRIPSSTTFLNSAHIPGFIITQDYGLILLHYINTLYTPSSNASILATLEINNDGIVGGIVEFTLIVVICLLSISFAASIFMHCQMYRQRNVVDEEIGSRSTSGNVLTETMLSSLAISKFVSKSVPEDEDDIPLQDISESCEKRKPDWNDVCPICLEEFNNGDSVRELYCSHIYHLGCIDPWLTKNSSCCPLCKMDMLEKLGGGSNQDLPPPPRRGRRGFSIFLGPDHIIGGPRFIARRHTASLSAFNGAFSSSVSQRSISTGGRNRSLWPLMFQTVRSSNASSSEDNSTTPVQSQEINPLRTPATIAMTTE